MTKLAKAPANKPIILGANLQISANEPVRALSWKQPYASAMLHGKIETRTWATNYRGWVLICASKAPYGFDALKGIASIKLIKTMYEKNNIVFSKFTSEFNGHAIGIAKLVDCFKMQASDADKCYVNFNPDLYCHVYENPTIITPFKWKGTQGWSTLNAEQRKQIKPLK